MNSKHLVYGLHAIEALLKQAPQRLLEINYQTERQDKKISLIVKEAKKNGITVVAMPKKTLDKVTDNANHQGIIAYSKAAKVLTDQDLPAIAEQHNLLLILDNIQDPHNLGAIFRTAEAAGVGAIIAPRDKAAGITATVAKVSSGATEVVPFIQVTNLSRCLEQLKALNFWIYGAAGEAQQTIYAANFTGGKLALVMGAEGDGLRQLTRKQCDYLVKIPMLGSLSSLNVSVATGVILFEMVRQLNFK